MTDKKIEKQSQLAQETAIVEDKIDQITADKLANEIFDKVFAEELAKLIGSVR
jgi:hypothetical protein